MNTGFLNSLLWPFCALQSPAVGHDQIGNVPFSTLAFS